ncbi:MAG: D-aminoacyl-tRNA deacylase [Nonlabens sp.]
MKIVIQRVSEASVSIEDEVVGSIDQGILVLLGVTHDDTEDDVQWLCNKLLGMRIFSDENGKMNLSVGDVDGGILVVSQFTLYASTKKGNRPGYSQSAPPEIAEPLYDLFVSTLSRKRDSITASGKFGSNMQVKLINDGPVTIVVDSKYRE